MILDLPSEEVALQIAQRSILISVIYELWGVADTHESLVKEVKAYHDERQVCLQRMNE